ncbi:CCA tRNA nucleotidyltransferase, partial [Candidatus Woesearchaeota archaeon]|nr:CCA tRNA nucleotidyltransferase [Candidatus Woesearchaeota archaeon]
EETDKVFLEIDIFLEELSEALAYEKIKAELVLGGSTAKGTWLSGDHDIDLFVRFPSSYKDDAISDLLESALNRLPDSKNILRVHGSRDYFQLKRGSIMFELVPVKKITNPKNALNVTDMSSLHVAYVNEQIGDEKKLRDDIRLTKQFCKAQRVYGAESYMNGFSGHVVDLLVLTYGSFRRLLQEATEWPEGMLVLDPAGKHADPLKHIDDSKLGPLVIVDPVQPGRNAAAALSTEQYMRFKIAAQKFLKKPSLASFSHTLLTAERAKKKIARHKGKSIVYLAEALDGSDDVAGTKLLKAHEYILKRVSDNGFTLANYDWEFDNKTRTAIAYIIVNEARLPTTFEREGPPLSAKKNATHFKEKHRKAKNKVVARDDRLYATIKQKHRTLSSLAKEVLSEKYCVSRSSHLRLR